MSAGQELLFVLALLVPPVLTVYPSPFNGQHAVVTGNQIPLDFNMIRNESGYIVKVTGVAAVMLPWLAEYYNFTYSIMQIKDNRPLDTIGDKPGLISYLMQGECDIVTTAAATEPRVAVVDFSHPFLYPRVSYSILKAETSANIGSIGQPFTSTVWIIILLAIIVVILSVYWSASSSPSSTIPEMAQKDPLAPAGADVIGFFILGVLIYQAGNWHSRRTPIRFIVAGWCLAAFILSNYYTGLVTSFLAEPIQHPLIQSIYDLRDRPGIRLVTERGGNVDATLMSAKTGFFKLMGDRLRAFPNARCNDLQHCLVLLKEGNTVHVSSRDASLLRGMREDFQATGKCNLQLGSEFMNLRIAWAARKNSPYIDYLNLAFMKMHERGLIYMWYNSYVPDARQCQGSHRKDDDLKPYTLNDLSGAFALLMAGYGLSVMVLVYEKVKFYFLKKKRDTSITVVTVE